MATQLERLNAALTGRYVLVRESGRGGMATVFLAHDPKHERQVAIKVLRPDLAASLGTTRFLKEIEIAARLTHPHIVPLYDSGEADSFLYYVMPFIEGESLRGLLNRERQIELRAVVAITVQVADALSYAHRMGVLHRDVKPENILLSEGHAFVTDFGIAKAVSSAGGANLTRTGFALGTPGYMSPEQAAGSRTVDARTDVYGLAGVLYEMLVGETLDMWLTEEAVRLGRFIDAAVGHRARLDKLPGRLEQVLARALAMRPTERFATAAGFADAVVAAAEHGGRRYSDAELRDIVGRAADLQAAQPTEEGFLSIGGVEQVAAQVGIPPAHVREALQEMEPAPDPGVLPSVPMAPRTPPSPPTLYGLPTTLRYDRTVSHEMSETALAVMVDEVQASLGMVGRVAPLGGAVTWTNTRQGGSTDRMVQVTITPQGGGTSIRVEEQLGPLSGRMTGTISGGIGGLLLGFSFGLGFGTPDAGTFFALVFGAMGSYFGSRSIYMHARMQRERQLETLADRLAALVAPQPAGANSGAGESQAILP
jgi:hypothetical protein